MTDKLKDQMERLNSIKDQIGDLDNDGVQQAILDQGDVWKKIVTKTAQVQSKVFEKEEGLVGDLQVRQEVVKK
jgi:hypothetical protein